MISPGKTRHIGRAHPGAERFEGLVGERFNLATALRPDAFVKRVERWASRAAYDAWLTAYRSNEGNFLDHAVWGADRDLGGGVHLYGAMDDRYATSAARVFVPAGLDAARHVEGKRVCVVGAWDGTECLLLRALGASAVDAVEEVPAFCEMATAQYETWNMPGTVARQSLYELDVEKLWQRYDLVYVPGVLYHLTDLPAALVILWSLLKPGGVLAFESIADPSGPCAARYLGAAVPGWNWWSPTPQCYEAIMRDCGFPDARTVECDAGRGWWLGTRAEVASVLAHGAAGFSRPDLLRAIARLAVL
jgi:2-polyprenyl-3-methyl-5-hydroxy-6-metoxy-1,4-benzoquinol methylase